ncbi:MAG: flagellar hook assembly protein FlgD [Gammaproteobacteria bacterium]|nr:flagellar hook assembly protein FlgD [Gammaproteobacteria bacterium]
MIGMPTNSEFDFSSFALQDAQKQSSRNELGQEEFLMLMLTQLQNQDPTKPMEDGEFIAQMAQFTTVEELGGMSKSIENLASSLTSSSALQAATMVGRSVLVEGESGVLPEGGSIKGGINIEQPVGNAFVRVFDASGQFVREMPMGPQNVGVSQFEWDGLKSDGEPAEPGNYYVRAGFRNGETEQALTTLVASKVEAVTLGAGGTTAQITTESGAQVGLSQIKAIM